MITKAILASVILASSTYGASELFDTIKPAAEAIVATSTVEAVLRDVQYLETFGYTRDEAFARALVETPDADGIVSDGERVIYNVVDTCVVGYFGPEYKKIVEPC
jgi:hypothetical protein